MADRMCHVVQKSGVAPPWKKAFSLMKTMRCLQTSRVYGKQNSVREYHLFGVSYTGRGI